MSPRVRCDEKQILELVAAGLTNDQLCAELGVTTRTFTRWRVARPALSTEIIRIREGQRTAALHGHGTPGCYKRGCRCRECTAVNSARHLLCAQRARSKPIPGHVPHGTASTYGWYGCRCRPCTDAHTARCRPANRRYQQRQRLAARRGAQS